MSNDNRAYISVYVITIYYLALLFLAFWFLCGTWSDKLILSDKPLQCTIIGGIFGSILYGIRRLVYHYARKGDYDSRWIPKYIMAPWEGAGLALIVLALIRGGVVLLDGSPNGPGGDQVSATANFAALGIGALVGFSMRDVIGWLGNLTGTLFNGQSQNKEASS